MEKRRTYKNIIVGLVIQTIKLVYGFIVPKIIISYYGSELNGLISSITRFLGYITLLESGFGPVVKSVLYKPIAEKDRETIAKILKTTENFFRRIAGVFIIYIIVLGILYPVLKETSYDWLFIVSMILIVGISTFAEYFFGITYSLFLQASGKTYIVYYIQIFTYTSAIICTALLAYYKCSIHVIKLATGVIFVLKPVIQNIYVRYKCGIVIKNESKEYNIEQKWDGLTQHLASVVHNNTDITVLTLFSTLTEVSVYSVYNMVIKGIKAFIQAMTAGIDANFGNMLAKKNTKELKEYFNKYESIYDMIITVVFSCTIVLITPFVVLYTHNVNDANYNRPLFSLLLVVSEFIWAVRLPYTNLILAAGHFKETKNGAIIECIINIIVSVICVIRFGIIGVTIGTIVSMIIRTIEFMIYVNKKIIYRNGIVSIKNISIIIISTTIICILINHIQLFPYSGYVNWIKNGFIVFMIASIITIITKAMTVNWFNKKTIR